MDLLFSIPAWGYMLAIHMASTATFYHLTLYAEDAALYGEE